MCLSFFRTGFALGRIGDSQALGDRRGTESSIVLQTSRYLPPPVCGISRVGKLLSRSVRGVIYGKREAPCGPVVPFRHSP